MITVVILTIVIFFFFFFLHRIESFRSLPFEEYRKLFMCRHRENEPDCGTLQPFLENQEKRERHKVGALISSDGTSISVFRQRDYSNHGAYRLLLFYPCVSWSEWFKTWNPWYKCESTWEIWKDHNFILPSTGDTFTVRDKEYTYQAHEGDDRLVRLGTLFPRSGDQLKIIYRSTERNGKYYVKISGEYQITDLERKEDLYHDQSYIVNGIQYRYQADQKL